MKAIFLNPPFLERYDRVGRWQAVTNQGAMHPPIWLLYAATLAKAGGHDVQFIDSPAEGLDFEATLKRMGSADALVMETATSSFNNDVRFAAFVKQHLPNIKVAMMGAHVTSLPIESMKEPIDAIIYGEADQTAREWVDKLKNQSKADILGLVWRDKGRIIKNPPRPLIKDLDSLPIPDRSMLPIEKYSDVMMPSPFSFYYTMRGCGFRCIYCHWVHTIFGGMVRFRRPELAAKEILNDIAKFKLKFFYINDECFTIKKDHVIAFCRALGNPGVPWGCYFRSDNIDEELLKALKGAGCTVLRTSPEVGSDAALKVINKGGSASMENDRKAFKMVKNYGFGLYASFVLGIPGETKESIKQTAEHAIELDPDYVQFALLQPLPGTPFYEYLKKNGYLLAKSWDDYLDTGGVPKPVFEYPQLSRQDLIDGWYYCWRRYYLRPKFIIKTGLRMLRHPSTISVTIKAYLNMRTKSLSKKVRW